MRAPTEPLTLADGHGEHAPIDWTGERPKPSGLDDIVVRLPIPQLELSGVARP